MITIGEIPQKVKSFFQPVQTVVSAHVYAYYCNRVIALCVSHSGTIQRLVERLRNCPHRTNHGEFLWRSAFDEIGSYGKNLLNRTGVWYSLRGLRKTGRYKLIQRIGTMNKLGTVKVVFSKRRDDRSVVVLVSNDLQASMKKIVSRYLKRWAIEVMIKEQKQHLGPGDYRVGRYRAIVRHLSLVDSAYACLTHVGLKDQCAQGDKNETKDMLSVPPISQLKARMHQIVWREEVQNVIKVTHEKSVIRRLEKLLAA
jgi:hypothetical protein